MYLYICIAHLFIYLVIYHLYFLLSLVILYNLIEYMGCTTSHPHTTQMQIKTKRKIQE